MLLRIDLVDRERFAFGNQRQRALVFLVFSLFVTAFLIDFQEAIEFLNRSGGAEYEPSGLNIDRRLIEKSGHHLRGNKTLPNQSI